MDKSAADSVAASLTEDSINASVELKNAGLPPATLLEAAAVVIIASGNQTATLEAEATL